MAGRARSILVKTAAVLLVVVATTGVVELGLRLFMPFNGLVIGRVTTERAGWYGWAFAPGDALDVVDPDTGEIFTVHMNNHGWRDRDRTLAKPPGTFRVVVVGDSNTFGVIVKDEALFTRVLEDRLRGEGYDVEVLAMGFSGWGTDQEVEAIRREALAFQPDLLVLQYCDNDPAETVFFQEGGKWAARKPVYYTLDEDTGDLVRRDNPAYEPGLKEAKDIRAAVIQSSEILKRLHAVGKTLEAAFSPTHTVTDAQARLIAEITGRPQDDPAIRHLLDEGETIATEADVLVAIDRFGLGAHREAILRVTENRHFNRGVPASAYHPEPVDPTTFRWRLVLALYDEAKRLANDAGADFAVWSDREAGHYRWARSWHHVAPGIEARAAYLSHTAILKDWAAKRGAGFIEPVVPVQRARNDSHPNAQGNRDMAENFHRWLVGEYGDELPRLGGDGGR